MLVFSGSSNQQLAKKIAKHLRTRLGKIELSKFPNDEVRVWVKEKKVNDEAVVVQSFTQPVDTHIIEFCLIVDALKRKGVKRIIGVIPWLAYSRQDKVFRPGEPLSAKVIAMMLQTVGVDKIITYDLHSVKLRQLFKIPIVNLSGRKRFRHYFKPRVTKNTLVVAPDEGAAASSARYANDLGVGVRYITKKRDLFTGRVRIKKISGPVKGARVLIKDDTISSGSTVVEIAKFLKKQGVQSIEVAATHHMYLPGVQQRIDKSGVNMLVVADTVEPKEKSKKLKVLSVAERIAEEIQNGA